MCKSLAKHGSRIILFASTILTFASTQMTTSTLTDQKTNYHTTQVCLFSWST